MSKTKEGCFTTKEVAYLLSVKKNTVLNWVKEGYFDSVVEDIDSKRRKLYNIERLYKLINSFWLYTGVCPSYVIEKELKFGYCAIDYSNIIDHVIKVEEHRDNNFDEEYVMITVLGGSVTSDVFVTHDEQLYKIHRSDSLLWFVAISADEK